MSTKKPGIFKLIFGRIWAAWAAIAFVATMLIMLIPFFMFSYFAPDPTKTRRFIRYARVWMGLYLPLIGCPLRRRGLQNFVPGENYIVVCNHNSFMDIPVSSPSIPGGNKTIAKIEISRVPLFGYLYKAGSILVDRKSETSRKDSLNKMKRVLEMGLHMCIYPEGTRNKSDEPLKPFHDGAFRLAIATGKPILPGLIFNTRETLPSSPSFYMIPHRLEVHFLPSIPLLPDDTTESIKQRTFQVMEAYYKGKKNNLRGPLN
ncbi:MAG: 1-acyl-sn-glycerol-3-phosphate acyltransferase [Chitinophagaceae bacterium]|nr:MAG: 1-acyl-sn-glycerol-3-phosphate acyltransferase [Chitinophagaceae bacterium]